MSDLNKIVEYTLVFILVTHVDLRGHSHKMHLKFGVTEIVIRCITEQVGNDAMSSKCMSASNVKVRLTSYLAKLFNSSDWATRMM